MAINIELKNQRVKLGYTMAELAKMVGVSEATISRWESGDIANMKRDKISSLAKALQVTPAFIMGWEDEPNGPSNPPDTDAELPAPIITEDTVTFPVIGEIAAGFEHIAAEDWEGDTIEIPHSYLSGRSNTDFFVLKVKGDSMYPLYHDGDRVLILKQENVDYSGDIGAVIYDDEKATLKKVEYVQGEWMKLVAINPAVPPETIEGERLEHCRIIGIPKLLLREIKKS